VKTLGDAETAFGIREGEKDLGMAPTLWRDRDAGIDPWRIKTAGRTPAAAAGGVTARTVGDELRFADVGDAERTFCKGEGLRIENDELRIVDGRSIADTERPRAGDIFEGFKFGLTERFGDRSAARMGEPDKDGFERLSTTVRIGERLRALVTGTSFSEMAAMVP
jgi:hypothetical protein